MINLIKFIVMKHIQLLILLLVLTGTSLAQENKHLTFKGIPIDGTIENFVKQLKTKGFEHIMTERGVAVLVGDFASFKQCTVAVSSQQPNNLVQGVAVIFNEKDTWSRLSGDYFYLKEMLTEKYGEPTEVKEEFDSSFPPSDDGQRMHMVLFDNCKYKSTYQTSLGKIVLTIDHQDVLSAFVGLGYVDKVNNEIIRKKAIDDL